MSTKILHRKALEGSMKEIGYYQDTLMGRRRHHIRMGSQPPRTIGRRRRREGMSLIQRDPYPRSRGFVICVPKSLNKSLSQKLVIEGMDYNVCFGGPLKISVPTSNSGEATHAVRVLVGAATRSARGRRTDAFRRHRRWKGNFFRFTCFTLLPHEMV